ncbi:protein kinase [Streptomyces sp. NPDC002779]|uniref:serine/threonine-protein kinase n=1 Tax=Streptomyces sp. NPDC002779 TaxID=3364664 RepID=UPI00369C2042
MTGRYRLVESIGQGGMGRVWRAADEILDRPVAIKEMRIDGLDAEDTRTRRERTLREARATARIDHPHVVRVYDVVDEGERLWIVMELVDGRSLERIIAEEGPLSPAEAARIGLGLVAALRQVHERGVLHRDIKPGNVLVEARARRVVLTDFGIAAIQDTTALTMVGMLVGSPDYMAPERISGRPQGPPSDVWSLGATLCAALGGRSPFSRGTTLATLHAVLYEEPELPASAGHLRPILAALLEKEPELRPSLGELDSALQPIAFPPPTPTVAVPTAREAPEPVREESLARDPRKPEPTDTPPAEAHRPTHTFGHRSPGTSRTPGISLARREPEPTGVPREADPAAVPRHRPEPTAVLPQQPESAAVPHHEPDPAAVLRQEPESAAVLRQEPGSAGVPRDEAGPAGVLGRRSEPAAVLPQEPESAAVPRHEPGPAAVLRQEPESAAVLRQEPGSAGVLGDEAGPAGVPRHRPEHAAVLPQQPESAAVPRHEADPSAVLRQAPDPASVRRHEAEPTAVPHHEPDPAAVPRQAPDPAAVLRHAADPAAVPRYEPQPPAVPRHEPQPPAVLRHEAETERRPGPAFAPGPGPAPPGELPGPRPMPPGELPDPAAPVRPRPGRRGPALLAAAGLVTAGAVVAVVLLMNAGGSPEDDKAGGSASSSSAYSPSPTSPSPTVEGTARPQTLPPGARAESGGFAWVPPEGWRRDVKTGAEVHYTSPDGRQELVTKSSLARGDLMETWETSEQNAHQGQAYQKIRLEETTFRGSPAVVWEYTFTLEGVPWHARLLGFNEKGKSYQINTWYQPDIEDRALRTYEKVKDSFTLL